MTMSPTEFDNSRCDTGNYWLPFNSTSFSVCFPRWCSWGD